MAGEKRAAAASFLFSGQLLAEQAVWVGLPSPAAAPEPSLEQSTPSSPPSPEQSVCNHKQSVRKGPEITSTCRIACVLTLQSEQSVPRAHTLLWSHTLSWEYVHELSLAPPSKSPYEPAAHRLET